MVKQKRTSLGSAPDTSLFLLLARLGTDTNNSEDVKTYAKLTFFLCSGSDAMMSMRPMERWRDGETESIECVNLGRKLGMG